MLLVYFINNQIKPLAQDLHLSRAVMYKILLMYQIFKLIIIVIIIIIGSPPFKLGYITNNYI